ncbi:peptidylprolyl isomerase [Chloroflexota bacterium]
MKPKATPGQPIPSKRQLSRWEKEWKKRRIIAIFVAVVIIAAATLIGVGHYINNIKPWHQTVVKVNDQVFDMDYFVRVLRLYGADQYKNDPNQISQIFSYAVSSIQSNELIRQKSEEYGIDIDDITDDEIMDELKILLQFDPDNESEDDFVQRLNDMIDDMGVSRSDVEKFSIVPTILQAKLMEAIGDSKFSDPYKHARIKAFLVGTEEEALEATGKWSDFNQIVKDYSPTIYYPRGGYWLVRFKEETEVEGETQLHIEAMLLATKAKADELKVLIEAGGDFAQIAKDNSLDSSADQNGDMGLMSIDSIELKFGDLDTIQALTPNNLSDPISQYYPDDPIEWLPEGIETSSVFEEYVFTDGSEGSDISDPLRDPNSTTKGGYWLVMVLDKRGEGEEEELHIQGILLDSNGGVNTVKSKLGEGESFTVVAGDYSLHTASKGNGGDMDWLSLDSIKSLFGEDNLEDIQALGLNTLSETIYYKDISKPTGYWLIEVLEKEERLLSENHQGSYINDYYRAWAEEQTVEEYVINVYDKWEWALDHL